jgi:hypothetical protein
MHQSSNSTHMGSNMSKYIPHKNTKQNLLKQVLKIEEYIVVQTLYQIRKLHKTLHMQK